MIKQLLILALVGMALAAPSSKVEPRVFKTLKNKNVANIFVKFGNGNQDILRAAKSLHFASRGEKITHLVSALRAQMQTSQSNVVRALQSSQFAYSSITFKQFWSTNELSIRGANAQIVNFLESQPEISEIREARVIQIEETSKGETMAEWNLEKVEAPNAWQLPGGNNGAGVVVSSIDTGVRSTHQELRNNHRQDYGWFDPYYGETEPSDSDGHGTHTMGTIAGAEVGVAPGAQWISCMGCWWIFCTEDALKGCGEWTTCPTRPDGSGEDCSKAPQLSSNSWGGGQGDDFYNDVIALWHAADIIPVFAIGNDGPRCGTANSPGDQDVIGVGATTSTDDVAEFSSLGPSVEGVLKPDVSAPGHQIRSATSSSDTAYSSLSGTSMACPHVAGAVALLLSRNPGLSYDEVKELLQNNNDRNVGNGPTCDNTPPTQFPNHVFGHGRLNARKALEAAISRNSTVAY